MKEKKRDAPGFRQFVKTADNHANLPFAWQDLLLAHGLERRSDLNNRFATAHGRNRNGREAIDLNLGGENVWCPKDNLLLVQHVALLKESSVKYDVSVEERDSAMLFL